MNIRFRGTNFGRLASVATFLAASLVTPVLADTPPAVVVSIKPIHSLVTGVMQGVATPTLLVTGAGSPHTYSLKPSQAEALQEADLIFWIGPGLETFLNKPIETLGQNSRPIAMLQAPGVSVLLPRDKHDFEGGHHNEEHDAHHDTAHNDDGEENQEHDHDHAHEDEDGHDHGGIDPHIWLDPQNAIAMVQDIEATLVQVDPSHAAQYTANAKILSARIEALDKSLTTELAPVADRPFAVFHDAYQYFEAHFGLHAVGVLTLHPESRPSAERVAAVQKILNNSGAACVFSEPQFPSKLVNVVTEGTQAKSGELDPLGAALMPGTNLYFDLMQDMADALRDCLSNHS
ncbi:MAG: zinc ABC transporter substrate-binding protein [Alphaproteobacteria bacterium]|nr:zinc ABC transporter substrate-binding protein [Alphaproteobacteria bacterium]